MITKEPAHEDDGEIAEAIKHIEVGMKLFAIPSTAHNAIKTLINAALQSTRKPERELDAHEKQVMRESLRSSVRVVSKPPVDTIAVSRDVLQGVREAMREMVDETNDFLFDRKKDPITGEKDTFFSNPLSHAEEALASLDAVLKEGE